MISGSQIQGWIQQQIDTEHPDELTEIEREGVNVELEPAQGNTDFYIQCIFLPALHYVTRGRLHHITEMLPSSIIMGCGCIVAYDLPDGTGAEHAQVSRQVRGLCI